MKDLKENEVFEGMKMRWERRYLRGKKITDNIEEVGKMTDGFCLYFFFKMYRYISLYI